MLIVNQLIPCDYSDTNVSMEMSSDSSGESQDLGEVNTGLKMAYFPNVSRPQWEVSIQEKCIGCQIIKLIFRDALDGI